MKVVVFYPYDTGDRAFSGGVAKVAVSNVIAVHINGDQPYLLLPKGNTGLINYVKEHCPYCEIAALDFQILALFSDTKNPFTRLNLILKNMYKFFQGKNKVKRYLNELNPDVIHFHETITFPFFSYGGKAKKIIHYHSYPRVSRKILTSMESNAVNKYIDVALSPTKSIKDIIQSHINKEIQIIRTPYLDLGTGENVDLTCKPLEEIKKKGRKIFSFVGRINSIKRLECCLLAMAKLSKEDLSKMKYVIIGGCNTAGDENYKKELLNIIETNGLSDSVEFVGYVNPIEKALPYIDYGVMLTKSEAMPMVGIEYLRYNIPTIGFDAPGINDYVETGSTGYLIKNGDVDDLAAAFKGILNGTNLYDFKNTIPPVFRGYSVESFAKAIDKIYK